MTWYDSSIKRPPQNKVLLFAFYSPMKDGTYRGPSYSTGVYRFGVVKGGGGYFHLPPKEEDREWYNQRLLWTEIEQPQPEHFVLYDPELFKERYKRITEGTSTYHK